MTNEPAPLGTLNKNDWKKGVITALLVGAASAVLPAISAGTLFTMVVLKAAGGGAIAGLVGYILKNLGTNSEDKFLTAEPK